jgi:hypothetical protein
MRPDTFRTLGQKLLNEIALKPSALALTLGISRRRLSELRHGRYAPNTAERVKLVGLGIPESAWDQRLDQAPVLYGATPAPAAPACAPPAERVAALAERMAAPDALDEDDDQQAEENEEITPFAPGASIRLMQKQIRALERAAALQDATSAIGTHKTIAVLYRDLARLQQEQPVAPQAPDTIDFTKWTSDEIRCVRVAISILNRARGKPYSADLIASYFRRSPEYEYARVDVDGQPTRHVVLGTHEPIDEATATRLREKYRARTCAPLAFARAELDAGDLLARERAGAAERA